ncbi:MAG: hypothetical protein NVV70_13985 [Cellulomonas sp.]|nr:hypothetical protein [Cellulomonas sp.]MCR6649183.1 hypothetical protein [Cellulomonas sp.]
MPTERPPVFDERSRTDALPSAHGESTFAFLNRVAGDYWEQVRRLVQTWAENIAEPGDYMDLRARLRSADDHQFQSAFLELYVHESLDAAGYAVTIHPEVPGGTRRPDFVARRDGAAVYVEAIAPGPSDANRRASARRNDFLDTVNKVGDPNFWLDLDELSVGAAPPPGARLRDELRTWLRSLDPEASYDFANAPAFHWTHEDWTAAFRAIPKAPHARGTTPGDRAIGVYSHMPAAFVDDAPAIRAAIAKKHRAYGELEAPFVVVVGLYIFDTDLDQTTAALYGDVVYEWGRTADGEIISRAARRPNGYFGAPPGWDNRHVSAVLTVSQLQPWSVPRAETTLWRHPNPAHPLPIGMAFPGDTMDLSTNRLVRGGGLSPADLFALPDPWPRGTAFPPRRKVDPEA